MAIVTLTTDFGTADGYVGAMKGVILSRAPGSVLVDITHEVARHDVVAAAFALSQAAPLFPPKTIHVAVVDPGVGTDRLGVIVSDGRHLFVGPDNGVFSQAVPSPAGAWAIESPVFMRDAVSATFHGRDVFAAAAGALAAGAAPEDAGPLMSHLSGVLPLPLLGQHASHESPDDGGDDDTTGSGEAVRAGIVHVDSFGNLITDLVADRIPDGARFHAAGSVIERLSTTFGDVQPRELVAYVGSAGTLEIAVREGSAAMRLGLGRGDAIGVVSGEISASVPVELSGRVSRRVSRPLELVIDSLAAGGSGVARDPEGRVTFISHTAPGDHVRVRITQERRGYARGDVLELLEPSPRRAEPRCPLFVDRTCGGCQWQHIAMESQREGKRDIIASALRHHLDEGMALLPLVARVPDYGWRRRARLHWYRGRRARAAVIGFFAPGSHRVTPIDECPQLEPVLVEAVRAIRDQLAEALGRRGEISLLAGSRDEVHVVIHGPCDDDAAAALVGRAGIRGVSTTRSNFGVGSIELEPGLRGRADWFAQPSRAGNRALLEVLDRATRPRTGARIVEFYAGSGNLTRILADGAAEVIAVDTRAPPWHVPHATRFEQGAAADVATGMAERRERFHLAVLDPPRTGAAELIEPLVALAPGRIAYVSCDPATLARDLDGLRAGGYHAIFAQPIDLMPHTHHVEVVVALVRQGSPDQLGALSDDTPPEQSSGGGGRVGANERPGAS